MVSSTCNWTNITTSYIFHDFKVFEKKSDGKVVETQLGIIDHFVIYNLQVARAHP
jgi:hypothetical protein